MTIPFLFCTAGLLLPTQPAPTNAGSNPARTSPITMIQRGRTETRRTSRVGHVVRTELSTLIRNGNVRGTQGIPAGLQQKISIVDVDMSPDLRNARVKVSVIGDRQDKVSAVRWLRGNIRGLRHELAQRNRHMKRVPVLSFDHVDVGAATDMMVRLEGLRRESEQAEAKRDEPDEEGGIDFNAKDDEAWAALETEDEDDDGGIDFGASDEDAWLPGETVIDLDDEDVSYEDDDDIEAAWAAATHK